MIPDAPASLATAARKCPSCQAPIEYDPAAGALRCSYCATTVPVPRADSVRLHDLAQAASYAATAASVRAVSCRHCGATSELGANDVATRCAFCTAPLAGADVVTVPPSEGVVPFAVPKSVAGEQFSSWLKGLWLRPSSLRRLATLRELRGVYVPGWAFQARAFSRWTAEAGYHYWEAEQVEVNGRSETRRVQKTRWEPVSGEHAESYAELLVSASRGLRADELDEVGPFCLSQSLVGFHPDFLAGFDAESPAVGAGEAWSTAERWVCEREHAACARDVPGDAQRGLQVHTSTSDEAFHGTLVPLWIGAYAYGGKRWRVLVNGLTGKVRGDAPWSVWKISLLVLAIGAALVALYAFVFSPEVGQRWLHGR